MTAPIRPTVGAGQTYGRLTVLGLTHMPVSPSRARAGRKVGARAAHCRCECGRETVARFHDLLKGNIRSCGCLLSDVLRERNHVHGQAGRQSRHPLYGAWLNIKTRCENPNTKQWKDYGGRGIAICERWRSSFENFLADMGERPGPGYSIDRIDNDGNYEPGNVKWSTRSEQMLNRRTFTHATSQLRLQLLMTGNNWPAVVD